ncbi:hypothetical protein HDU85_005513 [Gaertneriomyces sp. JEL0708]|nr:hypothetical protein HDU85_005513 [Gaertneriomyces sp. JEL0708]
MGVFSFEDQLFQYGQYHNNKINQYIHIVFVPTILWTALVWLSQVDLGLGHWALDYLWPLNAAFVVTAAYNLYYIALEPVAGTMYAPILFTLCHFANTFAAKDEVFNLSPNMAALLIHVTSWIFQFIGHGAAEGRAPALLDNLVQALVLAPFFVWIEVLFMFGYRPAFRSKLQMRIDKALVELKRAKTRKAQ